MHIGRVWVALRLAAAVLGGYVVAMLVSLLLIRVLPIAPAQSVLWALLLSFLVYAITAIAAFALWRSGGLRRSLAWVHTWAGLLPAWLLYFIFVTGTLGYLNVEIDRWMQPELVPVPTRGDDLALIEQGLARLSQVAAGADRWVVELPARKNANGPRIIWRMPATADYPRGQQSSELLLNDSASKLPGAKPRHTGGGMELYQLHYRLHYLPTQDAYWLVGLCSMFMLVSLITGVIIHKRILRDFFSFRPGRSVLSWREGHTALGVFALPFHLVITYSGLVLLMSTYMPWVHDRIYDFDEVAQDEFFITTPRIDIPAAAGVAMTLLPAAQLLADPGAPPTRLVSYTVRNPNDSHARIIVARERTDAQTGTSQRVYDGSDGRYLADAVPARSAAQQTRDTLTGLHKGLFAGPLVRALYVLSGLMGSALIATGVVLWTVKRSQSLGAVWMRRLNPGVIIGLPLGIAAYLAANRLLPLEMSPRGSAEINTLFAVWVLAVCYGLLRPSRCAWRELSVLTILVFASLPCLDYALTPQRVAAIATPLQTTTLLLCSGCLLLLGLTALSLAQGRRLSHWALLSDLPVTALRGAGALALAIALMLCWQLEGGSRAWVTWAGGLTLAALSVTGLHTLWQLRRQR